MRKASHWLGLKSKDLFFFFYYILQDKVYSGLNSDREHIYRVTPPRIVHIRYSILMTLDIDRGI